MILCSAGVTVKVRQYAAPYTETDCITDWCLDTGSTLSDTEYSDRIIAVVCLMTEEEVLVPLDLQGI
jgi:hypothetical protein